MKRIIQICFVLTALFAFSTPADAQLGKLLNKVNKALDKTNKTLDNLTSAGVVQEWGGTLENPLANLVDVQLAGVYGSGKSENYGDVTLVFRAKMIAPKNSIYLGSGYGGQQGLAIDEDGNQYKFEHASLGETYDTPEGIYTKITFLYKLIDVRKTAKVMQVIRLGIRTDWDHTGFLVMKNVPVDWNGLPAE